MLDAAKYRQTRPLRSTFHAFADAGMNAAPDGVFIDFRNHAC
jgi:hypothetical protein